METKTVRAVKAPQKQKSSDPLRRERAVDEDRRDSFEERNNWSLNSSLNKVQFSKAFLANLGYTRATLPKESALLGGIVHARDAGALKSRLQELLADRIQELNSECRLRAKTGGYRWYRIHGRVVRRDKYGRPLTCSGTIRDVHSQKIKQKDLARPHSSLMANFQTALAESQAPLAAVYQAADDAIWVVDPKTFTLAFVNKAFENLLLKTYGVRARLGMRVEEVFPAESEKWTRFYKEVLKRGQVDTDYQVPGNGETIHVLFRRLVCEDGEVFGIVGFGYDITDRTRIYESLRKSEAKFSALFHHSPLAIALTRTSDDRYIEINEAFEKLTGYTREEVLGKTPYSLGVWVNPRARVKIKKDLVSNKRARFEFDYRTKTGEVRAAIGSASLMEIDGELCVLAMCTDITDHRRIEEALRKSEEKYSALVHQRSIAVVATSMIDDRYLEVNEAFETATGYSQAEVIGKRPIDIEVWENPNERLKFKNRLKASGHGYVEFNYRTKSGEICPALGSAVVIDIDGEPCMLGMAVDISGRRRAEEALRESEERLRIAIDSVRMYAFEWNPETDDVQLSAASRAILNIAEKDTILKRAEIVDKIVPEDKAHFKRTIESLSPANPNYKVAFRMVSSGQKVIWLEESGRAFFWPDGRLRKVIGMTFDATDARTAEQQMRELSGRLINSQEEERRRVARELHDHIGQELSLLCVQAQSLDSGASEKKNTAHADVHELYGRIKDIAVDVSRLSHRLHSSELAFLGLSAAAERLCRDFEAQHKIDVDYQIGNIRGLEGGKALCFYRILQEALQNVAKHSHATKVVVELMKRDQELVLKVVDNGLGFDPGIIQVDSGLGLISMRERLNLIGGQMEITSKLGGGTFLTATVLVSNDSR